MKEINIKQPGGGIVIITLSNNYDHQDVAYSMFNELSKDYNVYSIGLSNPKNPRYPNSPRSFYYNGPKKPGICKGTFNLKVLLQIVKKINSLPVEYVYFESEHLWNAFIMLLIKKKFKKVQVIHDIIPHSDSKGKNLANKVTCKLADYVLIRNNKYIDELINRYKVKRENIIVMPLWRYYPQFQENKDANGFLFFGRIRNYKGIDTISKLANLCPNIHFDVVGMPDNETKNCVEELKKIKNVSVVDREVNEVEMEKYFRDAKAIILPYHSATQSGVIIDSYKYGKPVIAFNVGAICEQIEDGVSGYLVEQDNLEQFSQKIQELNNKTLDEYLNLQKSAYEYGYDKYSVKASSNKFIERFLK